MADKGKNIVELTDEQYAAFKLLFPLLPAHTTKPEQNKTSRRRYKNDYRAEIAAEWKKKHPFS